MESTTRRDPRLMTALSPFVAEIKSRVPGAPKEGVYALANAIFAMKEVQDALFDAVDVFFGSEEA